MSQSEKSLKKVSSRCVRFGAITILVGIAVLILPIHLAYEAGMLVGGIGGIVFGSGCIALGIETLRQPR